MEYRNEEVPHVIEQMGILVHRAFERYSEGSSAEEVLELSNQAISLAVDMDPCLFVTLAPQSMVFFLELMNLDSRVIQGLAEALELQADVLLSDGWLVEADARRGQAVAVLSSLDPARAN